MKNKNEGLIIYALLFLTSVALPFVAENWAQFQNGTFLPFFASHTQPALMIGASNTIKPALKLWKYAAGIDQPNTLRSVCSAAKKVSEAPACSKHIQKKITKIIMRIITHNLSFSTLVSDLSLIITNGPTAVIP